MMHLLGLSRDRKARIAKARVDNQEHRRLVSCARKAIYESNFDVDSAPVERMLKPQSLVPTTVSGCSLRSAGFTTFFFRTPIQSDSPISV
jgi:hypothetical protein